MMSATGITRIHILDCYTDPLGWKDQFVDGGNTTDVLREPELPVNFCKDVRNMDKVFSLIIELGRGNFLLSPLVSISKFQVGMKIKYE